MVANPSHLSPVAEPDDSELAPDDDYGTPDVVNLLDQLMHNPAGTKLPKDVRGTREILANRTRLALETHVLGQTGRRFIHDRSAGALVGGIGMWDRIKADLGPSLTEDQLKVLDLIKDNFVARSYDDMEHTEEVLTRELRGALARALARPDDAFRRLSPWESFVDGVTAKESVLKRRGLKPLKNWDSLRNALKGGDLVEERLRQDDLARLRAAGILVSGMEGADGQDVD